MADLFGRLAAAWERELLTGWDDHLRLTSGGRLDAKQRKIVGVEYFPEHGAMRESLEGGLYHWEFLGKQYDDPIRPSMVGTKMQGTDAVRQAGETERQYRARAFPKGHKLTGEVSGYRLETSKMVNETPNLPPTGFEPSKKAPKGPKVPKVNAAQDRWLELGSEARTKPHAVASIRALAAQPDVAEYLQANPDSDLARRIGAVLDETPEPAPVKPPPKQVAFESLSVRARIDRTRLVTQQLIKDSRIGQAAEQVAERTDAHAAAELRSLAGVTTRAVISQDKIVAFRQRNVDLVSSIADDRIEEFSELLEEADKTGMRVEELRDKLQERFDVSKSKADLLARDQVLKLNGEISAERQQAAGIEEYTWSTSGDERVRPYHRDLDGSRQRWDAPPVVSKDGRREHPGQDFQCRCVPIPVVPWLDD